MFCIPPKFVICLLVVMFSSIASAQITQIGHGNAQCAVFNQAQNNSPEVEQAFDAWIIGYISGVNFMIYTIKKTDLLSSKNAAEISSFVRGYCRANPTKTVTNAANEYWFGLSEQQNR
jgi:hypothetical protein